MHTQNNHIQQWTSIQIQRLLRSLLCHVSYHQSTVQTIHKVMGYQHKHQRSLNSYRKTATVAHKISYPSLLEYRNVTVDNFKSPARSTAVNHEHTWTWEEQNISDARSNAMTGQTNHFHSYSLVSVRIQLHGIGSQQLPASQHTLIRRGSGEVQKLLTHNTIEQVTTWYETEQSWGKKKKTHTLPYEYDNTDRRGTRQKHNVCFAQSVQV